MACQFHSRRPTAVPLCYWLSQRTTSTDGMTDVPACVSAAKEVIAEGSMQFVAVHFPAGAVAVDRTGRTLLKPSVRVPKEEIVGANGAGDAFGAGLIFGLAKGWELDQALALGHAAAATSLRSVGTTGGVESWRRCLQLANEWGWRGDMEGSLA